MEQRGSGLVYLVLCCLSVPLCELLWRLLAAATSSAVHWLAYET